MFWEVWNLDHTRKNVRAKTSASKSPMRTLLIGTEGCDRSTAYHMSGKFVFREDGLWVTWLGNPYTVRVARVDLTAWSIGPQVAVAHGFDNHCAAALASDAHGRLHVMAGAHHQSFIHRFSENPADPASWSVPQAVGKAATYPSLVTGKDGKTLHLAYRSGVTPWILAYQQGEVAGDSATWSCWSKGQGLLRAPSPGYCFWTNSLACDSGGTLHLLAEFYKRHVTGPTGYSSAVTRLFSNDEGFNWYHDDGRPLEEVPAGLENVSPILHRAGGDLRPGSLCVLSSCTLAFTIFESRTRKLMLALRANGEGQWRILDCTEALSAALPGYGVGSPAQLVEDGTGRLHACFVVNQGENTWGNPGNQLAHAKWNPGEEMPSEIHLLPRWREEHPDWLPSLAASPDGRVYLLHQSGATGKGNINTQRCDVVLRALVE